MTVTNRNNIRSEVWNGFMLTLIPMYFYLWTPKVGKKSLISC